MHGVRLCRDVLAEMVKRNMFKLTKVHDDPIANEDGLCCALCVCFFLCVLVCLCVCVRACVCSRASISDACKHPVRACVKFSDHVTHVRLVHFADAIRALGHEFHDVNERHRPHEHVVR